MKSYIILFCTLFIVLSYSHRIPSSLNVRRRREVGGALHIVTNHAQPIHEDVKPETEVTAKPCPENNIPSPIEMGTVFQVTPPKDTWFQGQSLRKSLPLTSKLDLIRSISRFFTLSVLLLSGIFEFYPMLKHLYYIVSAVMYL